MTLVNFHFVIVAPPKIVSPASVVRALPYYRMWCRVTGTPPIYTALIRQKTNKIIVLVNTTDTGAIQLGKEGNYTCMATSKYGTDVKEFSVIFTGKNLLIRL